MGCGFDFSLAKSSPISYNDIDCQRELNRSNQLVFQLWTCRQNARRFACSVVMTIRERLYAFHSVEIALSELELTPFSVVMSQAGQPNPSPNQGSRGWATIGLALIAVLALAFAGYTLLNPQSVTITQQQVLTNTQSVFNTQTVTSVSTVTSLTTATTTATSNGFVNPGSMFYQNYQNCGYYGCYYQPTPQPAYASVSQICQSTGQNDTVQCSGYFFMPSGACPELAIPYINPAIMETQGYLYVTLYNLPANHPAPGAYVTVTGHPSQGFTAGPAGEQACTDNTITVTSIS